MKTLIILASVLLTVVFTSMYLIKKSKEIMEPQRDYPKSLASFSDFKDLVSSVETYRQERLISLDTFLQMSKEDNVIILDTRSEFRFKRKHLKNAIHLNFSDFTQDNLKKLIPDPDTKILIYCNNNFKGDQIDFASKMSGPIGATVDDSLSGGSVPKIETQILSNRKPIMLALNIPTFINLYGYGYRNIYELDELVNINDSRIVFEGSVVKD